MEENKINEQEKFLQILHEAFGRSLKLMEGKPCDYSEKHLLEASFVFLEVLTAKMWFYQKDKLNQKQIEALVEEIGNNLHKTILTTTGVDMHQIKFDYN